MSESVFDSFIKSIYGSGTSMHAFDGGIHLRASGGMEILGGVEDISVESIFTDPDNEIESEEETVAVGGYEHEDAEAESDEETAANGGYQNNYPEDTFAIGASHNKDADSESDEDKRHDSDSESDEEATAKGGYHDSSDSESEDDLISHIDINVKPPTEDTMELVSSIDISVKPKKRGGIPSAGLSPKDVSELLKPYM